MEEQDITAKDISSLKWWTLPEVANRLGFSAEHVNRLTETAKKNGDPMLRSANFGVGKKRQKRVKQEWIEQFEAEREADARASLSRPASTSSAKHQASNPLWA